MEVLYVYSEEEFISLLNTEARLGIEREIEMHSSMTRRLWSNVERKCLYLLQRTKTRAYLLQIHAFMLRNALEANVNLLTKFISVCTSLPLLVSHPNPLALLHHARRVFDFCPFRHDAFLCNSMIKAHLDLHKFAETFTFYEYLKRDMGFMPDNYTFVLLAKSCSLNAAICQGKQLHNEALKIGFCLYLHVATALVDMYAKLGNMVYARKLFDEMTYRSYVSWTALIVGFSRSGDVVGARKLFDDMPDKDTTAYNAMVDGYVKLGDMDSARFLFERMTSRNVVSWTNMIYGYCHNGDVQSARSLFDSMPQKNLISWNTMIGGYCQNKLPLEALKLFHDMQAMTSLEPDQVTIVSILPAIADLGTLHLGTWIHQFVVNKRLDTKSNICTALLDMYAKCGEITKAKTLFDDIPEKGIASWNAMINGFAINGCSKEALTLFLEMLQKEVKPNAITMIGVLSACSRQGLVEEGKRWFNAMEGFKIIPQVEHYGCMVDLLGRAGCLEEAEKLIEGMPYKANGIILSSFLFSCGHCKDVKRAKRVLNDAVELEPGNFGNYVMMRNLYATERRWNDAAEVIKGSLWKNEINKEVGCSVIEVLGSESTHSTMSQLLRHMKGESSSG